MGRLDLREPWRDEDGSPPPRIERTVEWWKQANDDGWIHDAVDAVLKEHGVYTTPPGTDPPAKRESAPHAHTAADVPEFSYSRDARFHRLRDRAWHFLNLSLDGTRLVDNAIASLGRR